MSDEVEAIGWNAIDRALAPLYGTQEPKHWGAILPAMLGGNDPLQGISAYRSTFGGTPHWHFVTYGFSELYEKESDDAEASGYGFELTCRVIDKEEGDEPAKWVWSLMQNLARYVFRTGNVFEPRDSTTLNGPIVLGRKTQLVAALFAADPQLAQTVTPNGRLEFVQLVGITEDEYAAVGDWDAERFTALIATKNPALLTDVQRSSFLEDPQIAAAVRTGCERDGSSKSLQFANQTKLVLEAARFVLVVGANELSSLAGLLRGRLRFDREAGISSREGGLIRLVGSPRSKAEKGTDEATLALSPEDQAAIVAIPITRGDYSLPSATGIIRVVPTEIWNGERTKVERVIG